MKKIFVLINFVVLCSLVVYAQCPAWQWLNPLPQGNNLYSVYFTDASTGYSVGGAGTILKTNDSGTNWTKQSSGTSKWLHSVYFTDANTGYAVGESGTILKTTNAGINWTAQTSGTTFNLHSFYFSDTNTGYAVGSAGTIFKTTNAGTNWSPQTSGTTNLLYSVYFPDTNIGYAVGVFGTILKTTNAGTNWSPQTSGTTNLLYSVYFPDANTGYTVGGGGTILKTITGGELTILITNAANDNNIKIYPNPADGKFTIELQNKNQVISVEIYSIMGAKVLQQQTSNEIDLSKFPKGIYFVIIYDGEKIYIKKIVIQ